MVSYQRWTSIVFQDAKAKGADTGEVQTEIIKAVADVWNRRKDELSMATIAEAERIASEEIRVS